MKKNSKPISLKSKFNTDDINIFKNIGLSSIYKLLVIVISFILVPMSINLLGKSTYGLWLTIFSFISWFNFFDFGIGHGLRNKLTESLTSENTRLAKTYISTAYFSILILSAVLMLIFTVISFWVNWNLVFNQVNNDNLLLPVMIVTLSTFSASLFLKLINVIHFSKQQSSLPELLQFINQVGVILGVWFLSFYDQSSLLYYCIVVTFSQVITFLIASMYYFNGQYKNIRPSVRFFDFSYLSSIFNLGGKFFLIQIAAVLLYSTDSFIINYFISSEQVAIYNVSVKYFSLITIALSIFLTPYWSAMTKFYFKNDTQWIRNTVSRLIKLVIAFSCACILLIIISGKVFNLWLGELVVIPFSLVLVMGVNTIIMCILQLCSLILNSTSKVKVQLYVSLCSALINIPLSIFLAVDLELGITGVILATLCTNLFALSFYPFQVNKIINNRAQGIWNA